MFLLKQEGPNFVGTLTLALREREVGYIPKIPWTNALIL